MIKEECVESSGDLGTRTGQRVYEQASWVRLVKKINTRKMQTPCLSSTLWNFTALAAHVMQLSGMDKKTETMSHAFQNVLSLFKIH